MPSHPGPFTPRTSNHASYSLSKIPPTLWERVKRKSRTSGISIRQKLLRALDEWVRETETKANDQ